MVPKALSELGIVFLPDEWCTKSDLLSSKHALSRILRLPFLDAMAAFDLMVLVENATYTEPKPGSEKDLDPKKLHFDQHPWSLSAGYFLVEYLRGLEVFWCKKTGSIPLVCAHKKSNNCQTGQILPVAIES